MKLPASETDLRKPGKAPNGIEFKNSTAPRAPAEIVKTRPTKSRMVSHPAIKPIHKSVYVPEPSKQEIMMGNWKNTMDTFGNQEEAIKEFIQRYFVK
jgi:hypothetical protein